MHDELTAVDIRKMQEEIDYRTSQITPKLKEQLKAARDLGDLSENDEYHSVRRALNKNYGRIRYLRAMIDTAIVIEVDSAADVAGIFDKITVFDEETEEERVVTIVTTLRNDIFGGYISKESPFGQAIIGHKVGDRVEVIVNESYSYFIQIRKIEKGQDDESLPISSY
ncbi:MAG: GreA/GreB family elongation factor [Clostridia bacterium]|nr:GreA/GreB family elongation factor [Clostridia bacterium]